MADGVDSFVGFTAEDINCVNPDELMSSKSTDDVLKEYRSLDCSVCCHHFGFQSRLDPRLLMCSPRCLAIARTKMRTLPPGQFLRSNVTSPACHLAPLIGRFDNCSLYENCANGIRDPRNFVEDPSSDRWQGVSAASSRSSSRTLVNGPVKRDADVVGREMFGGGKIISDGPKRSMDETDTSKSKENFSAFKPVKIESKEEALQQARQNARLVKPVVLPKTIPNGGQDLVDAAPAPRPLKQLNNAERKISVPAITKVKVEEASVPTETVKQPAARKVWRINELVLSNSLVNQVPVKISFAWNADRYTIFADKDLDSMMQMDELIAAYCENAPTVSGQPEVGEVLLAPYDGLYYRARVTEILGNKVKVIFIDYGDSAVVEINKCKEPSAAIMKHPVYGVIFKLELNEECPPGFKAPPEMAGLTEDTFKIHFDAIKIQGSDLEWTGQMYINDKVTLNAILEKHLRPAGKAKVPEAKTAAVSSPAKPPSAPASVKLPAMKEIKPAGTPASSKPSLSSEATKAVASAAPAKAAPAPVNQSQTAGNNSVQHSASVNALKSPPSSTVAVKQTSPASPKAKNPFAAGVVKAPSTRRYMKSTQFSNALVGTNLNGAQVHMNFMWHLGKFTISAKEDDPKLDELANLILAHVEKAPGLARKPDVDEILLAPYDESYYRGKVTNVLGDMVTLEFIDYGDLKTVKYSDCKELSAEISAHPMYGIILICPDIQEGLPEIPALKPPMEGQIQLLDSRTKEYGVVEGIIWLDNENNWNEKVKEVVAANGHQI